MSRKPKQISFDDEGFIAGIEKGWAAIWITDPDAHLLDAKQARKLAAWLLRFADWYEGKSK